MKAFDAGGTTKAFDIVNMSDRAAKTLMINLITAYCFKACGIMLLYNLVTHQQF